MSPLIHSDVNMLRVVVIGAREDAARFEQRLATYRHPDKKVWGKGYPADVVSRFRDSAGIPAHDVLLRTVVVDGAKCLRHALGEIQNADIDAVALVGLGLPYEWQARLAVATARRGLHVYCENAAGFGSADLARVRYWASRHGCVAQLGMPSAARAPWPAVGRRATLERTGPARYVHLECCRRGGISRGLLVTELAPALTALDFGPPEIVSAAGSVANTDPRRNTGFMMDCRYAKGRRIVLAVYPRGDRLRAPVIRGERGDIECHRDRLRRVAGEASANASIDLLDQWLTCVKEGTRAVPDLVNAHVRSNAACLCNPDRVYNIVLAADAAMWACATGKTWRYGSPAYTGTSRTSNNAGHNLPVTKSRSRSAS